MNRPLLVSATAGLLALAGGAAAQSLTLDWAARQVNVGGTAINANSQAYDPVSNLIISSAYSLSTPTLYFYDGDTGDPASPAFLDYTWGAPAPTQDATFGQLSGFGIGVGEDGAIYLWDENDGIRKLDSVTDTVAELVSDPTTDPMPLARNISVTGTGENTYLASVGVGNIAEAVLDLFVATDTAATNFEKVGTLFGADLNPAGTGKAGSGLAPAEAGELPPYIATHDIVGSIGRLRVFELVDDADADLDNTYALLDEIEVLGVDVKFDMGDGIVERPVLIALEATATSATYGADVVMYRLRSDSIVEIARVGIPLADVTNPLTNRGSLTLDTVNKHAYVGYRGNTADAVVMARISYTLPEELTEAEGTWGLYH